MEVSLLDRTGSWVYRPSVNSILAVLCRQLAENPARIVLNSLRPRRTGIDVRPLVLGEVVVLVQRARALLAAAGVHSGDRVILSLSDPRDFLAWILGCFSSGLTAVPIPAPGEMSMPAAFLDRARSVVGDCRPAVVIVPSRKSWVAAVGELFAGVPVLESALLETAVPEAERFAAFVDQPPSVTAFLQYTSGSTGSPKGVVITHDNLIANCEAARVAARFTPEDHMVSWLPLHHDMGLVGALMTSIYAGMTTSIMTPLSFLGRPISWLRAIHELRATISVSPTFGYQLCVQKIPPLQISGLDLSCWRLAFVGAEPVTRPVLAAFADRFSSARFSPRALFPVYGLAEATLSATFPTPGEFPHFDPIDRTRLAEDGKAMPGADPSQSTIWIASVGKPVPGHTVQIVSPDNGSECEEREVGEVVFSGPSISTHYFGQSPEDRRPRLHTGDLGYIAEGRLYLVDRLKDLVIVGGQNYVSSDIESAIYDIPGVRSGMVVAFATSGADATEALAIVAEVDTRLQRNLRDIEDDIREQIQRRTGLVASSIHMAPKGTIEKTTSGKLRRAECRKKFESGQLPKAADLPRNTSNERGRQDAQAN